MHIFLRHILKQTENQWKWTAVRTGTVWSKWEGNTLFQEQTVPQLYHTQTTLNETNWSVAWKRKATVYRKLKIICHKTRKQPVHLQ